MAVLDLTIPEWIEVIIAALFMVVDGIGEGLVAITLGFATVPTAIGLAVAAVGIYLLGVTTPLGYRVEALIVAEDKVENRQDLLHVVVLAAIGSLIFGLLGASQWILDFISEAVLFGVIAGVGIILARAGVNMTLDTEYRGNYLTGMVTILVATAAHILFGEIMESPNAIVYTLAVSVLAGLIVAQFTETQPINVAMEHEQIKLLPNWREGLDRLRGGNYRGAVANPVRGFYSVDVLWGAAALLALRIGSVITFSEVNVQLAQGVGVDITPKPDVIHILAGISGILSGLFGGAPIEPLISGTAATPAPVISGAIFVGLMALVSYFVLIPALAQQVPTQAIAGFIFALGALIIFPTNIEIAVGAGVFVAGIATVVTGITDPFTGLVAGIVTDYAIQFFEAAAPAMGLMFVVFVVVDSRSEKAQVVRGYILWFLRKAITIRNSPGPGN